MKTEGNLPEKMPEGFEVYERPGGMVYIRKIQKTPIHDDELKYVQNKIAPLVDQEGEEEYDQLRSMLAKNVLGFLSPEKQALVEQYGRTRFQAEIRKNEIIIYEVGRQDGRPIMKYELLDEETREFAAYRWCFKGRIDGWMRIGSQGTLRGLVDKYCPALGTDRFYELW